MKDALAKSPAVEFDRGKLTDEKLIELYRLILKPRMIEEKMLNLLRQGKVSKWFAGIGQEAISVGLTAALEEDEWIMPLHRNLGVFTTRQVPLGKLFKQFQGKYNGFSKGRERSFHFGTADHHICGMISHLGPQLNVADGVALANKLGGERKVSVAFTGDGGTSEGDFHEAMNIAAVWELPVIFIIENNGYGLSTPVSEQFRCKQLADRGKGYGIPACTIDGNNVLEVYQTIDKLARKARRKPGPYLVECMTFRMRGHEEASGTKYVPQELFEQWRQRDPVSNYEAWLMEEGILQDTDVHAMRKDITASIESGLKEAFEESPLQATVDYELKDLFHHHIPLNISPNGSETSDKRLVDAIQDGLRQAMQRDDKVVVMGQDVAAYGGVFKVTEGFTEEFGNERVRNTPLCESGILSAGVGMSLKGYKSVIEMQFADFVSSGFNAIVNNIAKMHYRWGQKVDVVVRMPTGAGVGAGPFHSQSNEAWFTHTPGLKVVYPSNPYDAKGLLTAAIDDPNPVMFFEHKALYRSTSQEVPDDYYTLPIGKANTVKPGDEISLITYGMGVHWAQRQQEAMPDVDLEIIDLRTLSPIDWETIESSVRKTGKVILLHEDTLTGGIGGDISAWIGEHLFECLDAPVMRVASLDTPVPFAEPLEKQFLANARLEDAILKLSAY